VFSPNGKTMAYVSCASGDCLIMTMNVDGSNQKALYTPSAGTADSFYPEFSADGKSLVFFVITNSGPSAARQPHRNTRTSPWLTHLNARPKKSRPAVAGTGITDTGWYTMGLNDTAPSFVFTPNDWWGPAVFSADGKKLFVTDYDGTTDNIYSINLDGSGLKPLTTSTDSNAPDFSPVAYKNLIVFNLYNSTNNSVDVYVMDQDGSNQKLVHSTADTWEGLIDSYWD
jgi:Tol biopolymer transport system component